MDKQVRYPEVEAIETLAREAEKSQAKADAIRAEIRRLEQEEAE